MAINPYALVNSPINSTALDKAYDALGKQTNPFASFLTGAGNQVKTIGTNLSEFNTANLARELNNMQGEELTRLKNMGKGRYLDILTDRGYGNGMVYNPDDARVTGAYSALDKAERGQYTKAYLDKVRKTKDVKDLLKNAEDIDESLGYYNRDYNDHVAADLVLQGGRDTWLGNQGLSNNFGATISDQLAEQDIDSTWFSPDKINSENTKQRTNVINTLNSDIADLARREEIKQGLPQGTILNDKTKMLRLAEGVLSSRGNPLDIKLNELSYKGTTDSDVKAQSDLGYEGQKKLDNLELESNTNDIISKFMDGSYTNINDLFSDLQGAYSNKGRILSVEDKNNIESRLIKLIGNKHLGNSLQKLNENIKQMGGVYNEGMLAQVETDALAAKADMLQKGFNTDSIDKFYSSIHKDIFNSLSKQAQQSLIERKKINTDAWNTTKSKITSDLNSVTNGGFTAAEWLDRIRDGKSTDIIGKDKAINKLTDLIKRTKDPERTLKLLNENPIIRNNIIGAIYNKDVEGDKDIKTYSDTGNGVKIADEILRLLNEEDLARQVREWDSIKDYTSLNSN